MPRSSCSANACADSLGFGGFDQSQEWRPFVFAGLWDAWKKPDGQTLRTYTIVTTEPNETLAPVHNRMPVMLNDNNALDWLNSSEIDHALSLLKPFPADLMDGYDVSKLVNSPLNDTPYCIAPD